MIQKIVDEFMKNEQKIRNEFRRKKVSSYEQILKTVIEVISPEEYEGLNMDPNRIHRIDDGEYQGTLVFVIGAYGYQPCDYWATKVYYGSCSGCDTLEAILSENRCYDEEDQHTAVQIGSLWTLALHMIQQMKEI